MCDITCDVVDIEAIPTPRKRKRTEVHAGILNDIAMCGSTCFVGDV
jgi:hypothetical protein